uniref:CYTH domain-containing protein n=1 Tax=Angiostrongylus cantonensis TaxID=6313 RepID=A0A0K0DDS1_ANGCA
MHQSVVLKARVDDLEEMETLIFDLTDSLGTFFVQEDGTLGAALGERGAITKKRRVFTMDDVRIYLDDVADIGQFIDITVTLTSSEPDAAYSRLQEIRDRLKVSDDAIVPSAYLDMMMANLSFDDDLSSRKSTKSTSETESDGSV